MTKQPKPMTADEIIKGVGYSADGDPPIFTDDRALAELKRTIESAEPGLVADVERLERYELEMANYSGYMDGVFHYRNKLLKALGLEEEND